MKKHPILNLYCNEDGTKITLDGKDVHVTYMYRKGKKESGIASIKGHKVSVVRIICECYHGMRPDKSYFPQRADTNSQNNHYTNLSWGKRRGFVKIYGKVKDALYADLLKSSKPKDLQAYAKKYSVSINTIRLHKKTCFANEIEVVDAEIL